MTGTATAVAYCRVSTEEQAERQTIQTQREAIQRWAQFNGITIAQWYVDQGRSGSLEPDQRPGLRALLADAHKGLFRLLVVYRVDRLARDAAVYFSLDRQLRKAGVTVVSVTEGDLADDTAAGHLRRGVLAVFSDFERRLIRERSTAGQRRLVAQGQYMGGPRPFGYRVEGRNRQAHLVPDEEPLPGVGLSEVDVVRGLYQRAAEGWSTVRLAAWLNQLGVPPVYAREGRTVTYTKRPGRPPKDPAQPPKVTSQPAGYWHPGRVHRILTSPLYKGIRIWGKRSKDPNQQVITTTAPALVDEQLWRQAQEALQRNLKFSRRNAKYQYLLRGLIRCGQCGGAFVGWGRPRGWRVVRRYRCNRQGGSYRGQWGQPGLRCHAPSIDADWTETILWGELTRMLQDPDQVLDELRQQFDAQLADRDHLAQQIRQIDEELSRSGDKRQRLLDVYADSKISRQQLDQALDRLASREAALRQHRERLVAELDSATQRQRHLQDAADFLKQLAQRYQGPLSFDDQRRLVELLVDGITVQVADDQGISLEVRYKIAAKCMPAHATSAPATSR